MPELDDFLGGDPEEDKIVADPAAGSDPVVDPVDPVDPDPIADPVDDPKPADPAKPADPDPAEPGDVTGLKAALQAERAKRNDHKGRADRLEGEMAALKAQLDEAKRAPVAPAQQTAQVTPPQAVAIPNPIEDPEGFHRFNQDVIFNERMNMSELMLRKEIGDKADVDTKIGKFRELAAANPSLGQQLRRAVHPWQFAYDTAAKHQALEEIGDPTSYRSKLEAEIRASVMAEMAGTAPAPAPRVQLPQSLGTARSAGSRNVPVINAPESFDDILATPRK